MNNKKLVILAVVAIVLGLGAYIASRPSSGKVPKLNGESVLPELNVSAVADVEFGDTLKLSAGDDGWTVKTYHNYPVDRSRLADMLMKLTELKVGQVVRGKTLDNAKKLVLRDSAGSELASLTLGEKHAKWGRGRYADFKGETVLISETLDSLDGDGKGFVDTKIIDTPYISFNDIVEGLSEEELGFATGAVVTVTIGTDTNRVVTVGATAQDGSSRYLRIDGSSWNYVIPSYSADRLLK